MKARIGDWLVIEGAHVGERRRRGRITEVHGDGGDPPFVVRWDDAERETLFFPGEGTRVVSPEEIGRFSS